MNRKKATLLTCSGCIGFKKTNMGETSGVRKRLSGKWNGT